MDRSFEHIVAGEANPDQLFEDVKNAYTLLDRVTHARTNTRHDEYETIDTLRELDQGVTRRVTFERREPDEFEVNVMVDGQPIGDIEKSARIKYAHPDPARGRFLYLAPEGDIHLFAIINDPSAETQLITPKRTFITQVMSLILLRDSVQHVTNELKDGVTTVDIVTDQSAS
jgi:hypothetical protein